MARYFCATLDLEPDFGGRIDDYSSLQNISEFSNIIKKNKIKLTTFVATKLLSTHKKTIKELNEIGSEFEPHSHTHNLINPDEAFEIRRSKKAYQDFFKRKPSGYRAPKGMLSPQGYATLKKEAFQYDSSIYPTFVMGRHSNWHYPARPFWHKKYNLVELPFSVFGPLKMPLAMGYAQPLGLTLFRTMLKSFKLPPILVFDFHLWNLYPPNQTKKLPFKYQLLLARNLEQGFAIFNSLLATIKKQNYKPIHMSELHQMALKQKENGTLPIFP